MADDNSRKTPGLGRRKMLLGGMGVAAAGVAAAAYGLSRVNVNIAPGVARARIIPSDAVLPQSVDVVVIGGGFVGTSAALTLAERGVKVALCEKGVIAGEASGRSMGYVDSQHADPVKFPLLSRSMQLWRGMNERTGIDTGYRPTGLLASLSSEEEIEGTKAWLETIKGVDGIAGEIISARQMQEHLPGMRNPPMAALWSALDGSAEPTLAAPAMAEAARRKGAAILQGCAVRGIEKSAGRISGVITEKGPIRCQAVILAGGYWSPMFAKSLGISFDQFEVYLSMMGLAPLPNGPKVPLSGAGYGFRPQIDGGYYFGIVNFAAPITPKVIRNLFRLKPAAEAFAPIAHPGLSPSGFWDALTAPDHWPMDRPSPFEKQRILMPEFRPGPLMDALKIARTKFPAFSDAQIRERWAGVISTTLDNMPIISAADDHPGLYIGSGFSYGLTYGPGSGEALADLAMGRTPAINLHDYRLSRFTDGSEIRFYG